MWVFNIQGVICDYLTLGLDIKNITVLEQQYMQNNIT